MRLSRTPHPESHSVPAVQPGEFRAEPGLFGPAETSGYGNGPRPNIGYFGSYERLYWSFAKPSFSVVGSETATGPNTRGSSSKFRLLAPSRALSFHSSIFPP